MKDKFHAVDLSFNIGVPGIRDMGNVMDCNSGGSVICNPGTGGCGSAGMTCVGTSCSGKSATRELGFDSRILVNPAELEALQKELASVVARFAR
jgi:hypothetical protein